MLRSCPAFIAAPLSWVAERIVLGIEQDEREIAASVFRAVAARP